MIFLKKTYLQKTLASQCGRKEGIRTRTSLQPWMKQGMQTGTTNESQSHWRRVASVLVTWKWEKSPPIAPFLEITRTGSRHAFQKPKSRRGDGRGRSWGDRQSAQTGTEHGRRGIQGGIWGLRPFLRIWTAETSKASNKINSLLKYFLAAGKVENKPIQGGRHNCSTPPGSTVNDICAVTTNNRCLMIFCF